MLEGLADEKRMLEVKMANEKSLMISESQGLSEQLKMSKSKLEEAEAIISRESNLRAQLQEMILQLESDKLELQNLVQKQYDENDQLRTAHLSLHSKSQKDAVVRDNLKRQSEEQDIIISKLQNELDSVISMKQTSDNEREDLLNQISVLIEERDSARLNEEQLFEKLRERSEDLEKIQESYVDMSDRCNEYQDELSDLREKLEYLQDKIQNCNTVDAIYSKETRSIAESALSMMNSRSEDVLSPRSTNSLRNKPYNNAKMNYNSNESEISGARKISNVPLRGDADLEEKYSDDEYADDFNND